MNGTCRSGTDHNTKVGSCISDDLWALGPIGLNYHVPQAVKPPGLVPGPSLLPKALWHPKKWHTCQIIRGAIHGDWHMKSMKYESRQSESKSANKRKQISQTNDKAKDQTNQKRKQSKSKARTNKFKSSNKRKERVQTNNKSKARINESK